MKKNQIFYLTAGLLLIVALNLLGNFLYHRFDLTSDKRYTLSDETKDLVDSIEDPILIKVYLEGDFPAEFKRIQTETKQHLEELSALNKQIKFKFINPLTKTTELIEKGLQPSKLSVQEDGQVSQAIIFPWAVVEYKDRTQNVSLLSNAPAASQEEQLQRSIENLEYAFTDAIYKVSKEHKSSIAVFKGNGELKDIYLYSALKKMGEYFHLAEFTLDSVKGNPQKTLDELKQFDMAIIAKPSEKFSEDQKYVLDQYIMNGGKTLWLIDNIYAEMDSLMATGQSFAFNRDLALTDLLFAYGVRINYNVAKDLYSGSVRLATGNSGDQTQFQDFPWNYFPLIFTRSNHPINTNLDPVLLKFPSTIDTLQNPVKKTVLLQSSPSALSIGTPTEIALDEISLKPSKESFTQSDLFFGVLLEGTFNSAYSNRTKPVRLTQDKQSSVINQIIVISDGDLIANETLRGEPLPLDKDKWTGKPYGNLQFLLNASQYLTGDQGIMALRSKTIKLQFLDKERAFREQSYWQWLNIILPILLLLGFGFVYNFIRKRKYA